MYFGDFVIFKLKEKIAKFQKNQIFKRNSAPNYMKRLVSNTKKQFSEISGPFPF